MIKSNKLNMNVFLPLTCSRTGTCCHGKNVNLNPWELANLAYAKGLSTKDFRDDFCDYGGILLKFNGKPGWKNLPSCSQYIEDFGCSVHSYRPLVCRLFPLGRQRQSDHIDYIFQGDEFPCLEGCPEVLELPTISVSDYLTAQNITIYEKSADNYLELMQSLADVAFTLLFETGLSEKDDGITLKKWKVVGNYSSAELVDFIGEEWIDLLMLTNLEKYINDHNSFYQAHYEIIQNKLQITCNAYTNITELSNGSAHIIGLALYIGRSLGVDIPSLIKHWINIAKEVKFSQ
jgi:Fe-S-cluster containining protein